MRNRFFIWLVPHGVDAPLCTVIEAFVQIISISIVYFIFSFGKLICRLFNLFFSHVTIVLKFNPKIQS